MSGLWCCFPADALATVVPVLRQRAGEGVHLGGTRPDYLTRDECRSQSASERAEESRPSCTRARRATAASSESAAAPTPIPAAAAATAAATAAAAATIRS